MISSMKDFIRNYRVALVITLIIAIAIWFDLGARQSSGSKAKPDSPASSSTLFSATAPQSGSLSEQEGEDGPLSSAAPPLLNTSPPAAVLSGIGDVPTGLIGRIVKAFYTVEPTDTEPERRSRMAALVPRSVLATLDLSVPVAPEKDVFKKASFSSMQVSLVNDSTDSIYVLLPITVSLQVANGTGTHATLGSPSSHTFTVSFNFTRKNSNSPWQLVAFTDGQNMS